MLYERIFLAAPFHFNSLQEQNGRLRVTPIYQDTIMWTYKGGQSRIPMTLTNKASHQDGAPEFATDCCLSVPLTTLHSGCAAVRRC